MIVGLVITFIGVVVAVIMCLFGNNLYFRFRAYNERRRERCSQGGTTDQGPGSIELQANGAGENDALVSNTSNQTARNSVDAGATGSEGNMTELDQRPNHQGEMNGSSEGRTTDQGPGSIEQGVNDSSLNLTSNQASGSSGNLTITKTGAPTNVIYGNQYIHNHYHGLGGAAAAGGAEGEGGRIDKQTAESRAGNVETSQSSLPSAGSAAEAESKAVNMETSL